MRWYEKMYGGYFLRSRGLFIFKLLISKQYSKLFKIVCCAQMRPNRDEKKQITVWKLKFPLNGFPVRNSTIFHISKKKRCLLKVPVPWVECRLIRELQQKTLITRWSHRPDSAVLSDIWCKPGPPCNLCQSTVNQTPIQLSTPPPPPLKQHKHIFRSLIVHTQQIYCLFPVCARLIAAAYHYRIPQWPRTHSNIVFSDTLPSIQIPGSLRMSFQASSCRGFRGWRC